jgi:cobalt/nickel transport protein
MPVATRTRPKKLSTMIVILGVLLVIVLAAMPLVLVRGSEFSGADDAGSEAVEEIAPNYSPNWIRSLWAPPGGEMEGMLFALQAIAGGVLIGYFFGYKNGQRKAKQSPNVGDQTGNRP